METYVVMVSWHRTARVAGVYSDRQQATAAVEAAKQSFICDNIWVEPHTVDAVAPGPARNAAHAVR